MLIAIDTQRATYEFTGSVDANKKSVMDLICYPFVKVRYLSFRFSGF